MTRAEKIQYLQDVQHGKLKGTSEFLFNLLTIDELRILHDLLKKYGSIGTGENLMLPEELCKVEAIEKKYNERVNTLTKEELLLIHHDNKYFTNREQAIKVRQIQERLLIR